MNLVHDALAPLPPDDKAMRSRLLARLSVTGASPDRAISPQALAEEALALAEEIGDPQLVAQALAALNDALGGPDYVEQRRANAEQIVALARGRRHDPRAPRPPIPRRRARRARRLRGPRRRDRDLRPSRGPTPATLARLVHAVVQGCTGAPPRQLRRSRAATGRSRRRRSHDGKRERRDAGVDTAAVHSSRDRPGAARGRARRDRHGPDRLGQLRRGLGIPRHGDWPAREGEHVARSPCARPLRALSRDSELLATCMFFGHAAAAVGDHEALRDLAALLRPYDDLWIVDGISAAIWGPVQLELARIAFALGDEEEAGRGSRQLDASWNEPTRGQGSRTSKRSRSSSAAPSELRQGRRPRTSSTVRARSSRSPTRAKSSAPRTRRGSATSGGCWAIRAARCTCSTSSAVRARSPPTISARRSIARARAEYRRRLEQLDSEIEEAADRADRGSLQRLQAERDFLIDELSPPWARRASPTGRRGARACAQGRERPHPARDRRLGADHPALGRHLANSVQTGHVSAAIGPERPTTGRSSDVMWHRHIGTGAFSVTRRTNGRTP